MMEEHQPYWDAAIFTDGGYRGGEGLWISVFYDVHLLKDFVQIISYVVVMGMDTHFFRCLAIGF